MFYEELLKMFKGEIINGDISIKRIMGVLEYYEIWSEKFKEGEECKEEFTVLVCELSSFGLDGYCMWDLFNEKERRNLLGNYINELSYE